MYKVSVNEQEYELNPSDFDWDVVEVKNGYFHILHNNKSYTAVVLAADYEAKTFEVRVNSHVFELQAKDRFDLLADQLGFSNMRSSKVNEIKAPMPGLVLEIIAEAGQEVQKGDSVLILEAMKMENVIKAGGDGVIKAIRVEKGQAVEKNQVMIELE